MMTISSFYKTTFINLLLIFPFFCFGNDGQPGDNVLQYLNKVYEEADIPGMSVVVLIEDDTMIFHFGYSNIETKEKVNGKTLYQLGSCSKAFTALAAFKLVEAGELRLNAPVSEYIPWFQVKYGNKNVDITIGHLLNHTSGIPWNTIASIPATNEPHALEQTVQSLVGIKLHELPGKQYEYATINYDVVALVIEMITKMTFENYVKEHILKPLDLEYTSVGTPVDSSLMSQGYKIGFFKPRMYRAPIYRGNNAAGYVISNATDMARWLKYQMGIDSTSLGSIIRQTHIRNPDVAPIDNKSYAAGWFESLNGDNVIFHSGQNPNFTSFVGFNAKKKFGVAVLSNSNSSYTEIIGRNTLRILAGEQVATDILVDDNNDRAYSTITFIAGIYILAVLGFIVYVLINILKGNRRMESIRYSKLKEVAISILVIVPFLYGLYKLPNAMAGFTWNAARVWAPLSFQVMMSLLLASVAITYGAYFLTLFFPEKNKHKGALPKLLLLSALSGVANMGLILLITSALNTSMEVKFIAFYFGLTLAVYLLGRRFVQVRLIRLTRDLIYDLRVKLIEKIFRTSYQKFEKIDRGRIYTAFNDDVGTIGESSNMFIMLVTNLFTATAAMLYLATMAFWATALTTTLILILVTIYYFVSQSTHHYFEEARDSRNVFMRLLNGMIDGFKEISLHQNKKISYREDVASSANDYRNKISTASIQYVKASLVGETVLVLILGTAAFVFPIVFPEIQIQAISMFIIILLYLIGPVNAILSSVPSIKQLGIAWKRVQQFLKEIPASSEIDFVRAPVKKNVVRSIKVENMTFSYDNKSEHAFDVGPINLEVTAGEILFIIGGNGSGKTTLAKLLTGLYEPKAGKIYVDGREVKSSELGEFFSAVFNPLYLFEKLYNIEVSKKSAEIYKYLDLLDIKDKVRVLDNGNFSTVNLSGGQRKRLALLLCYLEDSPVYLFDEWAADQDPEYRKFFYRTLLPAMRDQGKIVIAITHDDHYFDIADRVVKMNQGRLQEYSLSEAVEADL